VLAPLALFWPCRGAVKEIVDPRLTGPLTGVA
jgi:hypothetical protein